MYEGEFGAEPLGGARACTSKVLRRLRIEPQPCFQPFMIGTFWAPTLVVADGFPALCLEFVTHVQLWTANVRHLRVSITAIEEGGLCPSYFLDGHSNCSLNFVANCFFAATNAPRHVVLN